MKAKKIVHELVTDAQGTHRVDQVKSMYQGRVPQFEHLSLKQFVKTVLMTGEESVLQAAKTWLHNKRASEKKPLKKIGRTHKARAGNKKKEGSPKNG